MPSLDDYQGQTPAWCPGCGNFGILNAVKNTLVALGIEPHQVSIKAKTGEGVDAVGKGEAIRADAVVLIEPLV